jgi:hypothetical protein
LPKLYLYHRIRTSCVRMRKVERDESWASRTQVTARIPDDRLFHYLESAGIVPAPPNVQLLQLQFARGCATRRFAVRLIVSLIIIADAGPLARRDCVETRRNRGIIVTWR